MPQKVPLLFRSSKGTLAARLRDDQPPNNQVTTNITCTATLKRNGVAIFTARAMTYNGSFKFGADDTLSGAYTCTVDVAEIPSTDGVWEATYTFSLSGAQVHQTVRRLSVRVDQGA